jgi:hypothetical protein
MLGVASATKVDSKFKVSQAIFSSKWLNVFYVMKDNQVDIDLTLNLKHKPVLTEFGNFSVYIQVK